MLVDVIEEVADAVELAVLTAVLELKIDAPEEFAPLVAKDPELELLLVFGEEVEVPCSEVTDVAATVVLLQVWSEESAEFIVVVVEAISLDVLLVGSVVASTVIVAAEVVVETVEPSLLHV